jgi:hypothetical protein
VAKSRKQFDAIADDFGDSEHRCGNYALVKMMMVLSLPS